MARAEADHLPGGFVHMVAPEPTGIPRTLDSPRAVSEALGCTHVYDANRARRTAVVLRQ